MNRDSGMRECDDFSHSTESNEYFNSYETEWMKTNIELWAWTLIQFRRYFVDS